METGPGWGDSDGGCPSYAVDEINKGILGSQIIFNTISDSLIGDEKNFVGARQCVIRDDGWAEPANPEAKEWRGNNITAKDGKYYIIRLYVHNNNPNGMDTVAEDTRVSFSIPDISSTTVEVNGFISSSNARPSKYWDYIKFNSDVPFHLEYIHGSALLENGGFAKGAGIQLPDSVTNQGNPTGKAEDEWTQIGYAGLDGKILGCYQYISYEDTKEKLHI